MTPTTVCKVEVGLGKCRWRACDQKLCLSALLTVCMRLCLETGGTSRCLCRPPGPCSRLLTAALKPRTLYPAACPSRKHSRRHSQLLNISTMLLHCFNVARQASAGHIRPTRSPSGQGQTAAKSRDVPNRGRESRTRRPQGRSVFWMSRLPIQWQPQLQPPFRKVGSEGGDEVDPLDRGAQRTGCRHQSETLWYALPSGRVAYSRSLATIREGSCIEGRAAGQSLHWLAFI
jgi:hypothetical protein